MKKIISIALAAVLALSLAACGGNSDSLSGKVATDGSTSMEKVIGALKETFEAQNTGVEVTYNPTGSGSGITLRHTSLSMTDTGFPVKGSIKAFPVSNNAFTSTLFPCAITATQYIGRCLPL